VLAALRREQPDRVPFVEGGVDRAMQIALMGRRDFQPEELNATIGLDNLNVDFLPPIFARRKAHDGISFVADPLIRHRGDLDKMDLPDPGRAALYRAAEALVARNQGRYAVVAKMRLGASPLLLSMGLEGFAYALAEDPGFVDTVLGRYADWTIAVVRRLRALGVDCVWTFDDMAHKPRSRDSR
jgi:hypothetical protein